MNNVNEADCGDQAVHLDCIFFLRKVTIEAFLSQTEITYRGLDQVYKRQSQEVQTEAASHFQQLLRFFAKLESSHIFEIDKCVLLTNNCRENQVFNPA